MSSAPLSWLAGTSPTPSPGVDPNLVTPGVIGFVVTLLIAVATVLLIIDMNRRIRRTRYRAEVRELLDAELREQPDADATPDAEATGDEPPRP